MSRTLVDYVSEALHAARDGNEWATDVVLAFFEDLAECYSGDMEIEHAVCWLLDAVRTAA